MPANPRTKIAAYTTHSNTCACTQIFNNINAYIIDFTIEIALLSKDKQVPDLIPEYRKHFIMHTHWCERTNPLTSLLPCEFTVDFVFISASLYRDRVPALSGWIVRVAGRLNLSRIRKIFAHFFGKFDNHFLTGSRLGLKCFKIGALYAI